ncbi:Competence protein ComGF [Pilibacter termitis]|uniref:Competence protein ComGF n=1 Tax=Pilibacter termitis TaxID=263852 RepID=A0A1T4RH43_9ENTE|nr:competence type IV pilus minor pilin ComGF [Pilibacter termitis]SKA15058.1 Competence protein ComGF [Pilibacter termitis]
MENLKFRLRSLGRNKRVRGFTLLECLGALLIIPCVLIVFLNLSTFLERAESKWRCNDAKNWQLFVTQMQERCRNSRDLKILGNQEFQLSFLAFDERENVEKKPAVIERFYLNQKGELIKTNENKKGFEPILMEIQSLHIEKTQEFLKLEVEFFSGKKEQAIWEVKDEKVP